VQVVVRINEAEDYTHEKRKSSPRGIMHQDRFEKSILNSTSFKLAAPCSQYIPDPPAISTIGERNEEALRLSKNIHRRSVKPA
jgi:hypothetical protein